LASNPEPSARQVRSFVPSHFDAAAVHAGSDPEHAGARPERRERAAPAMTRAARRGAAFIGRATMRLGALVRQPARTGASG
jgi:hypothetical protein